jgi:hypothetical protein
VTRALALVSWLLCPCLLGCAGDRGRDVVPESRDIRVLDAGAATESAQGYEYVTRRPLALVALAEARGIEPEVARQAVERLADALDACVTDQARKGIVVHGAARIVVPIDGNGTVGAPNVRIDPGSGVAESAVVCLVAPARLLAFPPVDAGARGMAIEALWGAAVMGR